MSAAEFTSNCTFGNVVTQNRAIYAELVAHINEKHPDERDAALDAWCADPANAGRFKYKSEVEAAPPVTTSLPKVEPEEPKSTPRQDTAPRGVHADPVEQKQFLLWFRGGKPVDVVYKPTSGAKQWHAARVPADQLDKWIARVGDCDGYFHVAYLNNEWPATGTTAEKEHAIGQDCIFFDYDAEKFGEKSTRASAESRRHYERENARTANALDAGFQKLGFQPSGRWISGAGQQGIVRLDQIVSPDKAEELTKRLAAVLGSDPSVSNRNRVGRIPGVVNTKTGYGREPTQANIISLTDKVVPLATMEAALTACEAEASRTQAVAPRNTAPAAAEPDMAQVKALANAGWFKSAADLPTDLPEKARAFTQFRGGSLRDLNDDLKEAGLIEKPYRSWSEVSFAFAACLKADGRFTPEQIAALLLAPLSVNKHIRENADPERAARRAVSRSHDKAVKRPASELQWREVSITGAPRASLYNVRLCIEDSGITCSYDTFHNKMVFGFTGDVQHDLQFIVGEASDDAVIMLRQFISKRYGFDPEDKFTRDAIKSLALEHCIDPVADLLEKAQAEWDGVERLDAAAHTYFNADDTPLNRAIIRKHLIAAVHRVRRPACKKDEICVLESPEGFNKSTAIRVLAGEENYSDQPIIGAGGREVQEALADVWMHENPELAGLSRAQVEEVKAFASRQYDIARPAYGHYQKRQPRHSIEWGTTNDSTYQQSMTGNRRFPAIAVRSPIDIEKLKRDRLQLLGEAAHYEAQGESLTLDEALWPVASAAAEERRVVDPWEHILCDIPAKYLHVVAGANGEPDVENVASADLLRDVLRIEPDRLTQAHSMRLARVMAVLGWSRGSRKVRIGGRQVNGYSRPKPTQNTGGTDALPF